MKEKIEEIYVATSLIVTIIGAGSIDDGFSIVPLIMCGIGVTMMISFAFYMSRRR